MQNASKRAKFGEKILPTVLVIMIRQKVVIRIFKKNFINFLETKREHKKSISTLELDLMDIPTQPFKSGIKNKIDATFCRHFCPTKI